MPKTVTAPPPPLTEDLLADISRAGYYPKLVTSILEVALGGEPIVSHLLQSETTFEETLRRHLTVLVLTKTRLVAAHVDDTEGDGENPPMAMGTTEAIPLHQIRSVGLTHVINNPAASEKDGNERTELNLAIGWGGMANLELAPATCGDPQCDGDHGYLGAIVPDDLVVRVAAAAEGPEATARAIKFAHDLSAASAGLTGGFPAPVPVSAPAARVRHH